MTASGHHETGPGPDPETAAASRGPFSRALAVSSFGGWLGLLAVTATAATLADVSYARANLAVAGVLALWLAGWLLAEPAAAALAGRKGLLAGADVLRAVLFVSIPVLGSLSWVLIAAVLLGALSQVARRAAATTHPAVVFGPAPFAGLAFSVLALANGLLAGLAGRFADHPLDLTLTLTALVLLVSAGLNARGPLIPAGAGAAGEPALPAFAAGRPLVSSVPAAKGLVTGMLAAFAAAGLVAGLAQTYVRDLGAGQPGFGMLFAAVVAGLALGLRVAPGLLGGFARARLFALALIATGLFLAAIALIPNMVMAVLLTVGLSICGGVVWGTGGALLGLAVDDTVRGRAFSYLGAAAQIALVAVLAIGPALAAGIGRHTFNFTDSHSLTYNGAAFVFLIAAVLAVAIGVATYRRTDDGTGSGLRHDLQALLAARRAQPVTPPARPSTPACSWHSRVATAAASPPRPVCWPTGYAPTRVTTSCSPGSPAPPRSACGCVRCCWATPPSWAAGPRPCCSRPTGRTTSRRSCGRRSSAGRSSSPIATSTPRSPTRAPGVSSTATRCSAFPPGPPVIWCPPSPFCSTSTR